MDILRYHKITDRDREGVLLEVFNDGQQTTVGAQTDVDVLHPIVPDDRILIVENWAVLAVFDPLNICDATQAIFGASYSLGGTTYFTPLNAQWNLYGGLVQGFYFSADMQIILHAGERPQVKTYFVQPGAHTVTSRIRGWLIPKGNLARGFGGL